MGANGSIAHLELERVGVFCCAHGDAKSCFWELTGNLLDPISAVSPKCPTNTGFGEKISFRDVSLLFVKTKAGEGTRTLDIQLGKKIWPKRKAAKTPK